MINECNSQTSESPNFALITVQTASVVCIAFPAVSRSSYKTIPFIMTSVAKIPLRFSEAAQSEGVNTIMSRGKGWSTAAAIRAAT